MVGTTVLRVASFNIRNGRAFDGWNSWPFRRRTTVAAIAELDAQIVGLQEVYAFQLSWLRRRLSRYEAASTGRTARRKGEHCPVLYEHSAVRLVDQVTHWYGEHPDDAGSRLPGARFPRIGTICRLELVTSGAVIQVACTHLDASSAERRARSVAQLVTWLDDDLPRVVLGDFNAEADDPVLDPLGVAGLRSALPTDAGGSNHDFTGTRTGRRIDHVFVSDEIEVLTSRVAHPQPNGRFPSDHWPVVADLRL